MSNTSNYESSACANCAHNKGLSCTASKNSVIRVKCVVNGLVTPRSTCNGVVAQ